MLPLTTLKLVTIPSTPSPGVCKLASSLTNTYPLPLLPQGGGGEGKEALVFARKPLAAVGEGAEGIVFHHEFKTSLYGHEIPAFTGMTMLLISM